MICALCTTRPAFRTLHATTGTSIGLCRECDEPDPHLLLTLGQPAEAGASACPTRRPIRIRAAGRRAPPKAAREQEERART